MKIKCKLNWPKIDCTHCDTIYGVVWVKTAQLKGKYVKQSVDNFFAFVSPFTQRAAAFAIRPAAVSQRFHCPRTSAVQEIKMLRQATLQMTK